MNPVRNQWCNATFLGPTEDIGDLPARRETVDGCPVVCAFYKADADEIDMLVRGATLQLRLWSATIPPISLGVIVTPDDEIVPKVADPNSTDPPQTVSGNARGPR